MVPETWCVKDGQTDGQMDGQMEKKTYEVGAPPKNNVQTFVLPTLRTSIPSVVMPTLNSKKKKCYTTVIKLSTFIVIYQSCLQQ